MPFVPVVTTTYTGSNTRAAFQAFLDSLNGLTPTRVLIPFQVFTIDQSLRYQGKGNLWLDAETPTNPPRFVCTADLDGSDQDDFNDLFNCINGVSVGSRHEFQRNIGFTHLVFDCTLQNALGVLGPDALPGTGDDISTGEGINLCGVELQNVHNGFSLYNTYIRAYGNAFVSASIDPAQAWELEPATVERDTYEACCTGPLGSNYSGITGSVIQLGAMRGANVYPRQMKGGTVKRSYFLNCGGPMVDAFNTRGFTFEHNLIEGVLDSVAIRPSQAGTLASFHSDFGLADSFIQNNRFINSGGVFLNGLMLPVFVTDFTPTQGPSNNVIKGNSFEGTALIHVSNNTGGAADDVYTNNSGYNYAVRWVGAGTVVPQIALTGTFPGGASTPVQTGSGIYEGRQFLVPSGFDFRFHTTQADSWDIYYAPNAGVGHIHLNAGNGIIQGNLGVGSNATTLNLSGIAAILDGSSDYDDIYNGMLVTNVSTGEQALIADYDGATGIATVAAMSPANANGNTVQIQTLGPGLVEFNKIWDNRSTRSPSDTYVCYDGRYNDWANNFALSTGDWLVGSAWSGRDTNIQAGCGYRNNDHHHNWIEDERSVKKLVSNYDDDTANSVDNVFRDSRLETGSAGTYTLLTARTRFFTARNTGPGSFDNPLNYARFLPGEKAGSRNSLGSRGKAGSLGRARRPL